MTLPHPRDQVAWLLLRIARILTRISIALQRDGGGAVMVAIYANDAVLGSWHRGDSGYAAAAATLARAEAEHLESHLVTLAEIDEMTRPPAPE